MYIKEILHLMIPRDVKQLEDYVLLKQGIYNNEVTKQLEKRLPQNFFINLSHRLTDNNGKRMKWERFEKWNFEWLEGSFYFYTLLSTLIMNQVCIIIITDLYLFVS